jgi:hypothetical protein
MCDDGGNYTVIVGFGCGKTQTSSYHTDGDTDLLIGCALGEFREKITEITYILVVGIDGYSCPTP